MHKMENDSCYICATIALFALFMMMRKVMWRFATAVGARIFDAVVRARVERQVSAMDECRLSYVFETTHAKCAFVCDKFARVVDITQIYNTLVDNGMLSVVQLKSAISADELMEGSFTLDDPLLIWVKLEYPFDDFLVASDGNILRIHGVGIESGIECTF